MPNIFSKKSAHRMYAPQPELQRATVIYIYILVVGQERMLSGEPGDYLKT